MIDFELYGGRRAYFAHLRSCAQYAIGAYGTADRIEWNVVARLVFVCQGNICRSPYAGVRAGALGVRAISAGLEATDGHCADESASRNALQRGIDLSTHRSTRLKPALLAPGDLLVVFEPWQLRSVMRRQFVNVAGVTLLGIWAHPLRPHIQDPFGRSERYFQRCFATIDLCIDQLTTRLLAHGAPVAPNMRPGDSAVALSSNSTVVGTRA